MNWNKLINVIRRINEFLNHDIKAYCGGNSNKEQCHCINCKGIIDLTTKYITLKIVDATFMDP